MKKKIIIIVIIFLVIIISIITIIFKKNKERELIHYNNIIHQFEDGLKVYLDATGTSNKNCNVTKRGTVQSEFLIRNGYIKKEYLLDVDGKSYCDVYAETDNNEECTVSYRIYIKCKKYNNLD